jgi:formate dehydrogenase major subunit
MTNHWNDIGNSDVILIMGSNAAENHPIGFKYVTAAMEKGATLISVDPRFTRTSSKADIYAQVRPGSDIAFLGGLVKYILDNNLWHDDYVKNHTNATFLINPDFQGPADLDGVFSGLDRDNRVYDKTTWSYQTDAEGIPLKDVTLQDPNCVFQLLKTHYQRYTPELVSETTGADLETLEKVYEVYASTGAPDRVGTMMYAMGWTQHTYGTQVIRTGALTQLLLGNIGRAGGGVNALRGESNVQGSTDHCILFHILPGYLKPPIASDITLEDHLQRATPTTNDPKSANWWQNYPKYFVSLLKSWYMDNATAENEFGYQWLPKLDGNYSWLALFEAMTRGDIKGFIAWGQNPVVGGANANLVRNALENLDWLVAVNLWNLETPNFWQRPGTNPAEISTEVFLLPCAASFEKEGSITNSGRWAQWRWKAVEPLGDSMPDAWISNELMKRVRALYEAEGGPNADAITKLYWDYGDGEVDTHFVAKEINGWFTDDVYDGDGNLVGRKGDLVPSFGALRADGTTCSANWLYSGSYTEAGNQMARRDDRDYHPAGIGLYSKWSWCWPVNRRIIYNRASCDASGQPYDPDRYVVWWKGGDAAWDTANGADVPDGGWPPGDKHAFIMKADGHGHIFGPGLQDGPFPEHYEPWESVIANPFSDQQHNPVFFMPEGDMQIFTAGERAEFPIIGTTYRVSEHWQSGAMTRNLPWLAEMQPEMFVEMSEELASELGIANADRVKVRSQRGEVDAVAMVTKRFKPYNVGGETVHVVGLPWHWGYKGLKTGSSANLLTPSVGDANTAIPETKAFLCKVERV